MPGHWDIRVTCENKKQENLHLFRLRQEDLSDTPRNTLRLTGARPGEEKTS